MISILVVLFYLCDWWKDIAFMKYWKIHVYICIFQFILFIRVNIWKFCWVYILIYCFKKTTFQSPIFSHKGQYLELWSDRPSLYDRAIICFLISINLCHPRHILYETNLEITTLIFHSLLHLWRNWIIKKKKYAWNI